LLFSSSQVISEQQGQELADELGLRFLETSAKSNINVEQAFFALARCVACLSSLRAAVLERGPRPLSSSTDSASPSL